MAEFSGVTFMYFLYRLLVFTANHFSKHSTPETLFSLALEYFWKMKGKNKDETSEVFIHTLNSVQRFLFSPAFFPL